MKLIVFRVLLVSFGLLLGVASVEWFMRSRLDLFDCDSELGWRFTSGMEGWKVGRKREFLQPISINSRGFRSPERDYAKPDGTYRIAVLGDSIVAALQVHESKRFTELLEERLNDELTKRPVVEVLNFGVDGYGTGQELLLYRHEAEGYTPDFVLLFLYPFNDLLDNLPDAGSWNHYLSARCGRPYFTVEGGELRFLGNEGPTAASWLDGWLRRSFLLYGNLVRPRHPDGARPVLVATDVYEPQDPEALRGAIELGVSLISELQRSVAASGARLGVVLVPDRRQGGEPGPGEENLDLEALVAPTDAIAQRLDAEGIPHLDLLPILRRHAEGGGDAYLEHDPHFNEQGHRVVAEAAFAWLSERCALTRLPTGSCPGADSARNP